MKIRLYADGRTDKTGLIAAFSNFANARKKDVQLRPVAWRNRRTNQQFLSNVCIALLPHLDDKFCLKFIGIPFFRKYLHVSPSHYIALGLQFMYLFAVYLLLFPHSDSRALVSNNWLTANTEMPRRF